MHSSSRGGGCALSLIVLYLAVLVGWICWSSSSILLILCVIGIPPLLCLFWCALFRREPEHREK